MSRYPRWLYPSSHMLGNYIQASHLGADTAMRFQWFHFSLPELPVQHNWDRMFRQYQCPPTLWAVEHVKWGEPIGDGEGLGRTESNNTFVYKIIYTYTYLWIFRLCVLIDSSFTFLYISREHMEPTTHWTRLGCLAHNIHKIERGWWKQIYI